jgi:hypothetical protein
MSAIRYPESSGTSPTRLRPTLDVFVVTWIGDSRCPASGVSLRRVAYQHRPELYGSIFLAEAMVDGFVPPGLGRFPATTAKY